MNEPTNSGFESLVEGNAARNSLSVQLFCDCDCYDCVCECDYNTEIPDA